MVDTSEKVQKRYEFFRYSNRGAKKFSWEYLLAATLLNPDWHLEREQNIEKVEEHMGKINPSPNVDFEFLSESEKNKSWQVFGNKTHSIWANRVRVTMENGERHEEYMKYSLDSPQNPVEQHKFNKNFRHSIKLLLDEEDSLSLMDQILSLELVESVPDMVDLLC